MDFPVTHKNYCDQHTITSPFLIFHFFIVNIHQNWTPSLSRQKYLGPMNSVIIHFQFSARFLNFQQFKNILFLPCFQFGRREVINLKMDYFSHCVEFYLFLLPTLFHRLYAEFKRTFIFPLTTVSSLRCKK